jgi:hypothetical protein
MLRLQKKHAGIQADKGPKLDGAQILAQQSIGRAIGGGIAVVLVFGWIWATLSVTTGRVFPWLSVLIGALVGVAVRRYGRGLNWRFPVIAALLAWIGAYTGNLIIGIVETGRYLDAGVFNVFAGLSKDTMENFFTITVSPVDHIYAFCAAGVASFLAKRRLNRREILAIRTMESEKN